MAANYEGWTEGAELGRGRWSVEEEHDIQLLETLYDRLKSPASRQLYLTAGHNAFMHCSWCKEDVDFLMYAAPDVMAAYVYFFIVVGLGSMSSRKIGWRNYAATILAVTMSVDLCITFAADETLKKELHGSPSNMDHLLSPYVKGFYLRYAMFALVALLMWLFDDRSATTQLTDQDIVTDLAVQLRSVYNRQQAGRIAKAAALGNKDLRRTYFEWYKLKEADKDAVYRDEDFKVRKKITCNRLLEEKEWRKGGKGAFKYETKRNLTAILPPPPLLGNEETGFAIV